MRELVKDNNTSGIQGFAPTRIQAVTGSAEWTPSATDLAFCVPADCTYTINNTGSSGTLKAGAIRVIPIGQTYTFSATFNIEVM